MKDGSGNSIATQKSAIGNRYTFQGREIDWDTGLYNFRARWYDSETGRWLSKDSIGIRGGFNQYEAFANNPVNYVDPYGKSWGLLGALVSVIGTAVIAVAAGASTPVVLTVVAVVAVVGSILALQDIKSSADTADPSIDNAINLMEQYEERMEWYDAIGNDQCSNEAIDSSFDSRLCCSSRKFSRQLQNNVFC